jgi:hypothetical protein
LTFYALGDIDKRHRVPRCVVTRNIIQHGKRGAPADSLAQSSKTQLFSSRFLSGGSLLRSFPSCLTRLGTQSTKMRSPTRVGSTASRICEFRTLMGGLSETDRLDSLEAARNLRLHLECVCIRSAGRRFPHAFKTSSGIERSQGCSMYMRLPRTRSTIEERRC